MIIVIFSLSRAHFCDRKQSKTTSSTYCVSTSYKSITLTTHWLIDRKNLSHVSTHNGTFGNECADELAKQATKQTNIDHHLLPSVSVIHRVLKSRIISEWQEYWKLTNSSRHTFYLIPTVSLNTCVTSHHTPRAS